MATNTALSLVSRDQASAIASQLCAANRQQIEGFEEFIATLRGELEKVQGERRDLAGKVHTLEGELEGSRRAHVVMQATLQRVETENGQLQTALQDQTTGHHRVRAELEVALREKQQAQTGLAEQQVQLATALRRVASQDRLGVKVEERRTLEVELKKVQDEIDAKQGGIIDTVALACGAFLALLSSWVIGLIVGLGGKKLVSYLIEENVNCPCTTPLFARQASIQGQLRLVNEEIERLKTV